MTLPRPARGRGFRRVDQGDEGRRIVCAEFAGRDGREQALPNGDKAVSIFTPLRCRLCRWKRQQAYQIDFKPNEYGGFLFPREPLYVCHRCLPKYQTDARVRRITRVLSKSEVAT